MLDKATGLLVGPVFDAVDIGLVVLDSQQCVIGWNEWIARVSRRPAEDVFGKNLCDVFPDLRNTRLPAVIDDAFQAGSSSILTHTLNTLLPLQGDRGEQLLHNIVVRPVFSAPAKYCLLQITDVTVAVIRERLLRERQNARYYAIVDSAPDAIITIDDSRKIRWVNGAVDDVLGYSHSELLEQKIDILLEPENVLLPILAKTRGREARTAVPVVGRYRDGKTGHFDVSIGHWRADQRDFVTTIWRDVTERVIADAALRDARDALQQANQELESRVEQRTRERETALRQLHESQKMESIGQLTGGVAHDFNNLLAVILGSLGLLKKAVPNDPRVSRFLDRAIQGAERGATLTTRLLAFARRQELKVELVTLQKLIPEMLDFLRHSVGPNIDIHTNISPDINAIEVDANQLELALINLAVNARDAMPEGGLLTITCHNEDDGKRVGIARDTFVCIAVTDTGEGMNEETLAHAQEPFFTTKGVGKGTGLGLSMVHGFIAQSGGTMRLKSELGKGTTVTLCLPRARENLTAPVANIELSELAKPKNLRVLLVDDDILVSMGAADMLLDLGHSVTEAQSGSHALRLLESDSPFDVVVTDYAMPGMNGFELAQRIKERNSRLPVILATGYAELPANRSIEFERLSKPYTAKDLAAAIEKAVNS
jgi:PAS domain S-box-containing protein